MPTAPRAKMNDEDIGAFVPMEAQIDDNVGKVRLWLKMQTKRFIIQSK